MASGLGGNLWHDGGNGGQRLRQMPHNHPSA